MTFPQISRYAFNNVAQRWFDTRNGRFASRQAVVDEMRRHQQATFNVLDNATSQLYAGQMTLSQWQLTVASELKDAHLAQAMFAVGGKRNMTQANFGRVGGTLASEYRFLNGFAEDIAAGRVSEAQALARIRQYGRATQQSYWREYREASRGLIWWELGTTEKHCSDCPALAAGSPYRPDELDTVPGAGDTQCKGNCDCHLRREAA